MKFFEMFSYSSMTNNLFLYFILVMINILSYLLMCYDKYQSKHKGKRISENTLLVIGALFGAIGIYMGMKFPLYHKSAKVKFKIGIPFLIVLNGLSIYVISIFGY